MTPSSDPDLAGEGSRREASRNRSGPCGSSTLLPSSPARIPRGYDMTSAGFSMETMAGTGKQKLLSCALQICDVILPFSSVDVLFHLEIKVSAIQVVLPQGIEDISFFCRTARAPDTVNISL